MVGAVRPLVRVRHARASSKYHFPSSRSGTHVPRVQRLTSVTLGYPASLRQLSPFSNVMRWWRGLDFSRSPVFRQALPPRADLYATVLCYSCKAGPNRAVSARSGNWGCVMLDGLRAGLRAALTMACDRCCCSVMDCISFRKAACTSRRRLRSSGVKFFTVWVFQCWVWIMGMAPSRGDPNETARGSGSFATAGG